MNHTAISNEDELLAALQDPEPEVRRMAAHELGSMATGDEGEVKALIEVMEFDDEERVREMAYWALNSTANLDILHRHPKWEARVNPVEPVAQTKTGLWRDFGIGAGGMLALGLVGLVELSASGTARLGYIFPLFWLGMALFSMINRRYGILIGMLGFYFANLLLNYGWLLSGGSSFCPAGQDELCRYAPLFGYPYLLRDLILFWSPVESFFDRLQGRLPAVLGVSICTLKQQPRSCPHDNEERIHTHDLQHVHERFR